MAGWTREDFLLKGLYTKYMISVTLSSGGYQMAYFSLGQLPVVTVVWMVGQVCYLELAMPDCAIGDQHTIHLKSDMNVVFVCGMSNERVFETDCTYVYMFYIVLIN